MDSGYANTLPDYWYQDVLCIHSYWYLLPKRFQSLIYMINTYRAYIDMVLYWLSYGFFFIAGVVKTHLCSRPISYFPNDRWGYYGHRRAHTMNGLLYSFYLEKSAFFNMTVTDFDPKMS